MMLGRGAQHKSSLCFGDAGECVWFTARPEAMDRNQALINLLQHIAREKRATPAQVALAWLLAQRPWIVPIPGTTKLQRLGEHRRSRFVLTQADLAEVEQAAAHIHVEGERYPPDLVEWVGR